MLAYTPLQPPCLECPVCSPGCSSIAGELPSTRREAMRMAQCALLEHPAAPVPRQCWHCAQAPCLEACPSGAMRRDAGSGLVWVDRSRCLGCWMCVLACPFGAVLPSSDGRYAVKCDGCREWETPACAGVCQPRDALFAPAPGADPIRQRRSAFASAGWGWPGPAHYPPPSANPLSTAPPAPAGDPQQYLIVGSGIAAVRAAEAIRASDARGRITLVSDESTPPYSRVLLSHHIAGLRDEQSLALRSEDWQQQMGVEMVSGDGAVGLDPDRQQVMLRGGRTLDFDRLLIATGAAPLRLPVPGAGLEGVVGLRTLRDAAAILSLAPSEAVVVGGGFIGLKAAEALSQLGARVAVVEKLGHLLPQSLDAAAAGLLRERLEAHGVQVITGAEVREIQGGPRVRGVLLANGRRLRSDLVVVGVGVAPNVGWLRGSSVRVRRGVVVDGQLRTGVAGVWAAGDVAESPHLLTGTGVVNALWPLAAMQGRMAGANMAGGSERFAGSLPMNALNLFGLPMASFGRPEGDGDEVVDAGPEGYRKRVYQGGALVGAILVGDIGEAGRLLAQVGRLDPLLHRRQMQGRTI